MHSYEVTERGKIIIAILIVLIIFVIPAIVLAVNAWNNSPPIDDPPHSTAPEPDNSSISDRPLPDGSGFNPPDPPESSNGEQGSFDPIGDGPEVSEFGPVGFSRSAGTMSFKFHPDLQNTLDSDTLVMIGEFITSPKNTADSMIAVEMPQISGDELSKLTKAIIDAFATHDVPLEKLDFTNSLSNSNERSIEVRLHFFTDTQRK